MTREEAIKLLVNATYSDEWQGNEDLTTAHIMAIKALEQEPCEDEYIKVPKKALKYRTAGMVAYNVEWLKNHFDIERTVILGCEYKPQEPRTGNWMKQDLGYRCSNCTLCTNEKGRLTYNYCPNCGAKMVEPQETETWNGYHGQITAPKGTFEKIYEDAESEDKE